MIFGAKQSLNKFEQNEKSLQKSREVKTSLNKIRQV